MNRREMLLSLRSAVPRTLRISVPSQRSRALIDEIRTQPGVLGLSLQEGTSLIPPGDIVTLQLSNRHYAPLMKILDRHGIGRDENSAWSSNGAVAVGHAAVLPRNGHFG